MQKKYFLLLSIIVAISGLALLEYTQGTLSAYAFDQMKYNYTSHVWIPPNDPSGGSLGGYYTINATGRDFKMLMVLPGAEKAESPLDYTGDGLHVTGRIETVKATYATILALYNQNVKEAMFNTDFNGTMNMTCAAWTGTSNFQNKNRKFTGTFQIYGTMTYWEGNYTLTQEASHIVLTGDYIYYPNNQPEKKMVVHKVYYL